ncbi:hypothetical protein F4679DRAFT_585650 [Xylaria curta]|nr:hypothetical protein F4679DRAFT_585650 [Xylaria curta]
MVYRRQPDHFFWPNRIEAEKQSNIPWFCYFLSNIEDLLAQYAQESSNEDIDRALSALDNESRKSELLMSVAPIQFVASGGALAVKYYHVRATTDDVDCFTDPNVDAAEDYRREIMLAVQHMADILGLEKDWFNDELKAFNKRMDLLLEAVEQDIVVFQGTNLVSLGLAA